MKCEIVKDFRLYKRLYKMKLVDTESCSFCGTEAETVEHLFTECNHACSFWEEFLKWWNTKFDVNLQLKERDILFGVTLKSTYNNLLNHCIIVAKQSLYTCRRLGIPPFFEFYLSKVKKIYQVEKLIAVQNRQIAKFERKWKDIFNGD